MLKSMDIRAWMVALFAMLSTSLFAQVTVTGVVTESTGDPVIGATVREKGSNAGTITDIDGNYSLQVANTNATLVVSYVGLETQEVKLAGRKTVNVELKSNDELLDEVVVVGYGTMKKSDLAGASVSMDESKIKGPGITSLDQSLQGRAAGVSAVQTSGAPGSSSSIRVRGQATINAGAEPLYVIDGVIVQGSGASGASLGLGDKLGNGTVSTVSPISTINPADILSMEILKDASATAIYGAQGANGVVLITTKRGKAGEAKFTYDGTTTWSRQNKRIDMLNLREFAEFYNDMVNSGEITSPDYAYSDPSVLGLGTNWQDAIFRTAFQQQHQISAQGGTDKVKYYVSGSWMDQEGTIIGSNFSRYSMRANLDAELKKWLKMGFNVSYGNTSENLKLADSDEGIIRYSLTTPPDIQIYNIDGGYSSVSKEGFSSPNPIAMAELNEILLDRQKLNGNIFFDVTPYKNLIWHTELGYDLSWSKAQYYTPMVDLGTWHRNSNEASLQKNSSLYWSVKNYLTYSFNIDKHSVNAMVGQEAWESSWDYVSAKNTGLPLDIVHNPALGTGTPTIGSGFGSASMASFFTRETYNYDNRYLLTYTYRYDGSSNFGPNKRWAGFNSVAAAWRFTEESFMQDIKESGILSNGKLRLGWGQTGNSNIGGYKWGASLATMDSGLGTSTRPANIKNLDIKWETQVQYNVGLDLGFLNDRLNLVVDAYKKISDDMLMPLTLPSYVGTSGNGSSALAAPWGNYGKIENKGLEVTINARPVVTDRFDWSTEFQLSVNRNKLVDLHGAAALTGTGQWSDIVSRTEEGESLYNFYGFEVEGVYEDFYDLINSPVYTLQQNNKYSVDAEGKYHWSTNPSDYNRTNTTYVGDIKYKDINGDGKIDENDKTNIGSPLPKFTFGWNNTFHYKNWDLTVFINGSYGNKVGNYTKMLVSHMNSAWTNQTVDVKNRARLGAIDASQTDWYNHIDNVVVTNPGAELPRATINDPNDNDAWSSRYIEDGSYIRLKSMSLSYTLDKKYAKWAHLDNVRVTLTGNNLLTLTKYTGYDPEVGASTQAASGSYVFGLDNGRYPTPTSFSASLNVTF